MVDFSDLNVFMELESWFGGFGDDCFGEKMFVVGVVIFEVMEVMGVNNVDINFLKEEIYVVINEVFLNVWYYVYGNIDIESGKFWWVIGLVDKVENSFDLMVVDCG